MNSIAVQLLPLFLTQHDGFIAGPIAFIDMFSLDMNTGGRGYATHCAVHVLQGMTLGGAGKLSTGPLRALPITEAAHRQGVAGADRAIRDQRIKDRLNKAVA